MSSRSRVLGTAAAAALVLPLLAAAPVDAVAARAPAPPVWGPVRTLVENPRGESLAVDAAGTVTVVWATAAPPGSVVALRRPAGGSWGRPVVIGHGSDPQVVTDGYGEVSVAWRTPRGRVVVAHLPAQGAWSDPVRVSGAGETRAVGDLALAADPLGDTVVAWAGRAGRGLPWQVRAAYRPAGGAWGDPEAVSAADGTRHPQVGIGADGTVVALLGRQRFGHPQVLRTRDRATDGTWTEQALVTREGYSPILAVDPAGNAVVAFSPDFEGVRAAYRPAGGGWSAARGVSPEGVDVADFALAMTGAGEAVLALGRVGGRVDVLRRPVEGPWSVPERVVARGTTVYDVVLAVDDAGDTFLGWGGYALLGAYRPNGGAWSEPFTISPETGVDVLESTHARIAPDGDVAVLWDQEARPLKVRLMTAG